jgi:hypothetical protein
MSPRRRITPLVAILGSLLAGSALDAQIRVDLAMAKRQFVAHEPVEVTVTITNYAGRDLLIHGEGVGRGVISWLDFSVTGSQGRPLTPSQRVNFPSARIPAGRSVAKTIDLNTFYRVTELGNYGCTAIVRLPGGAGTFKSNRLGFSITKGTPVFRQRIGDPASNNVREFTLSIFNSSDMSALYVHVKEVRTGRTLQAFRLGNALTFERPVATMDGQNVLNVLYLSSPGVYAHARVDPNGTFLGTSYFQRGASGKPTLQTFANGEVVVAGGVPYDPKAEERQQAQIRRLSERPAITYR